MQFVLAILVWLLMGFLIGWGLLLAVKGATLWLLALSVIGFIVLVGKIGCLSH
jgi:hypothetical protein